MSIKSNAFGRVKLTKEDAEKFRKQVVYGRPSSTAVKMVKQGVKLSREFHESGKVSIKAKKPVREKEPA